MPLPLGHTALGLASYEVVAGENTGTGRLKLFLWIVVLANLPDLDMVVGLLISGNGSQFHRGPTHSLIFALVMGFLASRTWRLNPIIPKISFLTGFTIIFSHVMGDLFFTDSPVSIFWPLVPPNWSGSYSGWQDVIHSVLFKGLCDFGVIIGSVLFISLIRMIRNSEFGQGSRLSSWTALFSRLGLGTK